MPLRTLTLNVHVAERSINRRHHIAHWLSRRKDAEIKTGVQGHIRTWWNYGPPISTDDSFQGTYELELTIDRRTCSIYLRQPVLWIQTLPYCPHAIHLCVVQMECRIAGAGVGVLRYGANDKVAAGMRPVEALEIVAEAAEVVTAIEEPRNGCGFCLVGPIEGDVPREAARVVVETVGAVSGLEGDRA